MSEGILPLRLFTSRCRLIRLVKAESEGIEPVKLLPARNIPRRLLRVNSVFGSGPASRLVLFSWMSSRALRFMPVEDRSGCLLELAEAVNEDRKPETSGMDNLNTLAMVTGACRSIELNRKVTIEEVLEN